MARLIDANKFEKLVLNHRADYLFKEDVIAALAKQPTVDAVEVVHGRWKPDLHPCDKQPYREEWYGYMFKCSVCGDTTMGDYDLVCRANYCPNCGAKMDK